MTLQPAYGRDYKSKLAVMVDFNKNKDFIIADVMHPYSGKPTNKSDLLHAGNKSVNIRYDRDRKIMVVKVEN